MMLFWVDGKAYIITIKAISNKIEKVANAILQEYKDVIHPANNRPITAPKLVAAI